MINLRDNFFSRLDSFINKHYGCLLIEGILRFCFFLFSSTFIFSLLAYLIHFSAVTRLAILIILLVSNLFVLTKEVLIVILGRIGLYGRMTYADACRLLQKKNSNFHDSLINILELSELEDTALVRASIQQKLHYFEDIDFNQYCKYNWKSKLSISLVSLVSIVILLFHNLYYQGLNSIIHYSINNSNFKFDVILNNSLLVEKGSDLTINANIISDLKFGEVYICYENTRIPMQKDSESEYTYNFKSINNSFPFTFEINGIRSKQYFISVYNSPIITDYQVKISHPGYVNRTDTIVNNQNIFNVPQGTILDFIFCGRYFDSLYIKSISDSSLLAKYDYSDSVSFKKRIFKNEEFFITLSNQYAVKDFLSFKIGSIADAYPEIQMSITDSTDNRIIFDGNISDDYGFSKLVFCTEENNKLDTISLNILHNVTNQRVFYAFEKAKSSNLEDKLLSCHFELFDNDAINGPKRAISKTFLYVQKSVINQAVDKEMKYEDMFYKLELSKSISQEIKNDINELRKKSLENNLSEWEKQTALQQIKSKTNTLKDLLDEVSTLQNDISNTNSFDSDLLNKQEMISDMFQSLIDEELKKMLDEILNLANEHKSQDLTKPAELKRNFEDFTKSLDRNLELLKKVKIEENLKNISDNLNLLSESQQKISDEPIDEFTGETLSKQQKAFEELHNQFNHIREDNSQLDKPLNIDNFDNEFNDIESLFNKEKDDLSNSDSSSFEKNTKDTSEKLKELAKKINDNVNDSSSDEEAENADDLRQILDNLFELSFRQENIIVKYQNIDFNHPTYLDQIIEQSELVDNFKIIRDSLYSLSRRTVYLGNHISNTAFLIEDNLINSSVQFQEKSISKAKITQRKALSDMNDLILILSESLKNIDNAASSGGKSSKNKKRKPQNQENSLSEMRSAQETLKNQMRDILNQMKSGNSDLMKKQIAKSLMENEIYQQMLRQMQNSFDIDEKTSKLLNEVKELMEKNHSDLANNKLSIQTVMRQQNIVTKLLQAENTENERDTEEKRIATTGKNINRNKTDISIEDIKFEKNIEFLKQNNIRLNSYYKVIFDKYLNGIKSNE